LPEEELKQFEEYVVRINRCATVVKGGRRFSFSALVVVGDRNGRVGYGFGKAKEVSLAVEKATKEARKRLVRISTVGDTIPHEMMARFGASRVFMKPASPGTGIIAGGTVRAVMEAAGVRDVLTKVYGNASPVNLVKATFHGLASMRTKEQVAALRGVEIE
jgi:small subunit ribosomal protein S5